MNVNSMRIKLIMNENIGSFFLLDLQKLLM